MDVQIDSKMTELKESVTADLKETLKEMFTAQLAALRGGIADAQQQSQLKLSARPGRFCCGPVQSFRCFNIPLVR